jgi:predicted DNA-binding transcriptional regulator YafY
MRSERLLSLVLSLADGRLHSAAELGKRYEVSVRSVYRDMELLSGMGFPVEAVAGREGGFRVLPGFSLERSVLDEGELAAVAAALGGLGRATGDEGVEGARSKLAALIGAAPSRPRSWIRIELAGAGANRARIEELRRAIEERRLLQIDYRDAEGGCTRRTIEPSAVVYLWQSWYLYAWCRLREDFRLFKLVRMDRLRLLMERFEPRSEPSEDAWREDWEGGSPARVVLLVSPSKAARADEWFGRQEVLADGGRRLTLSLPENDWLLGFLLSFGEGLAVLEPESLARALAERARRIWLSYGFSENPDRS